jgi:hypothetical protein
VLLTAGWWQLHIHPNPSDLAGAKHAPLLQLRCHARVHCAGAEPGGGLKSITGSTNSQWRLNRQSLCTLLPNTTTFPVPALIPWLYVCPPGCADC